MRSDAVLAILGMALVTYLTRAGGLWLAGHVPPTRRMETFLRHVPGAVLVAIVAPAALSSGPAGALAVIATVIVAARVGNLLLAMATGVVVVWLLRNIF